MTSAFQSNSPRGDLALQPDLFAAARPPETRPQGLLYREEAITPDEEARLVERFRDIEFLPFEFRGFLGRRRVASFGWKYDFNRTRLCEAPPPPDFLLELATRIALPESEEPFSFDQVSIGEYEPGAGIGWHRDRPVFGDVLGISLLAPCRFRLRCKRENSWTRHSFDAAPRSVYRLAGAARWEWEHSIPAVAALRYSITFRKRIAA